MLPLRNPGKLIFLAYGVISPLTGSYSNTLAQIRNKYLAISDIPGSGGPYNSFNCGLNKALIYRNIYPQFIEQIYFRYYASKSLGISFLDIG